MVVELLEQLAIAMIELQPAHPGGDDVGEYELIPGRRSEQPPFTPKPLVQGRLRESVEEASHRDGYPRLFEKPRVFLEYARIVGVEPDDHAGLHFDAV